MGDHLFTVSDLGIEQGDLLSLAEQSFVGFPQPQPDPQSSPPSDGGSGTTEAQPAPAVR